MAVCIKADSSEVISLKVIWTLQGFSAVLSLEPILSHSGSGTHLLDGQLWSLGFLVAEKAINHSEGTLKVLETRFDYNVKSTRISASSTYSHGSKHSRSASSHYTLFLENYIQNIKGNRITSELVDRRRCLAESINIPIQTEKAVSILPGRPNFSYLI